MAVQTLKKLAVIFILVVIFLGAGQTALEPFYIVTNEKFVTIWVVIKSDKGKTFIKMTIPTEELKTKYVWCGYYKNMDIYIRRN